MSAPIKSSFVLVTFDLHDPPGLHYYAIVKRELAKLELLKTVESRVSGPLKLPSNTFVRIVRKSAIKPTKLQRRVREAVRGVLKRKKLRATIFVAVGQNWSWGRARMA